MALGRHTFGVEWLNGNAFRRYPFMDGASLRDTSDNFTLPESVIADFSLAVHGAAAANPALFYLSQVTVFGTGVTFHFAYDGVEFGRVTATFAAHGVGQVYKLQGTGDYEDSVGLVCIWDIEQLKATAGVYTFDIASSRIIPTLIRPTPRRVAAILLGDSPPVRLQGDVRLVAGSNILLTGETDDGDIRIDALDGRNLSEICECSGSFTESPPIKTINGISPDGNGNITLASNFCLQLDSGGTANTITFTEDCAQPCCGSPELDEISSGIGVLDKDIRALEELLGRVQSELLAAYSVRDTLIATGMTS